MLRFLAIALGLSLAATLAHEGIDTGQIGGQPDGIRAPKTGSVVVAYSGPGDVVSGATAWYGLRAYNAAQATAGALAVNLRNTTTNETCDFPVVAAGGLGVAKNCTLTSNGSSLSTFCTLGCASPEAYDQSGNGNNVVQATAAQQPTLTLSCFGSLPCLTGASASSTNLVGTGFTSFTVGTLAAVGERTGNFTTRAYLMGVSNNGYGFAAVANEMTWGNAAQTLSPVADSASHATAMVFGATSMLCADNTCSSGAIAVLTAQTAVGILAGSNGSIGLTGRETEAGTWPSSFTAGQITSMCHNQYLYWGTSVAC
jgi:hypothetical protein